MLVCTLLPALDDKRSTATTTMLLLHVRYPRSHEFLFPMACQSLVFLPDASRIR